MLVRLFPVVHLHNFKHLVFAVDDITGKNHISYIVARAFMHVKGNVDAVVAVINGGCGHLNVNIAFVKTKGGNGVGVALEVFVLKHARARQPREYAACLEGHVFVKVATVELGNALDLDFLDIKLVAFFNAEHKYCTTAARAVFEAVGNLGKVKTFLVVQLADFLQVVRKHLFVQNTAGFCAHGSKHIVLADLVGAFNHNVVDTGLFHHGEDKHVAFKGGLHVAEVTHIPDTLDFFVDGRGIGAVTLADGKAHEHGIGIKHLHAAHLHIGKTAVGRGGRTHGNQSSGSV